MTILKRLFTTSVCAFASKRKPQLDQVSDVMIPGQYLRYFQPKKIKKISEDDQQQSNESRYLEVYKETARPLYEYDVAPTIVQERLAQRILRALSTVYTAEVLPTPLITQAHLSLHDVKVSRNLRKCYVFYQPTSASKKERGQVHRALIQYTPLLNTLIKEHAKLRRPLSVKFVSDVQRKELEAIFERLEKDHPPIVEEEEEEEEHEEGKIEREKS